MIFKYIDIMTLAREFSLLENLFLMDPMHHQLPDIIQSIEENEYFPTAGLEEVLRRQTDWVKSKLQFYRTIDRSCFEQSLNELKLFRSVQPNYVELSC